MASIVDTLRDLYPRRTTPDGGQEVAGITAQVQSDFAANVAFQTASQAATDAVSSHADLVQQRKNLAGFMVPEYDALSVQIPYAETIERMHHFDLAWVLTGLTLLPGIQSNGTVHNPVALFLTGLDIDGGMLAIPFDTKPVSCPLEWPISGPMNLRLSVQAAAPGGVMIAFPRVIFRFQRWAAGMPLVGGNQ